MHTHQASEIPGLPFSFLLDQLTVGTRSGCAWAPPFLGIQGKLGKKQRTYQRVVASHISPLEYRLH